MKNRLFLFLFALLLCFIPANSISAKTVQDSEKAILSQTGSSPYDMIMSNGEVVKYSTYVNSLTAKDYEFSTVENKGHIDETFMMGTSDLKSINNFDFPKSKDTPNEVVLGKDTRYKVKDTSKFPYRTTSFLYLSNGKSKYSCTGTVIGKNTVLTNAHCVYDKKTKSYLKTGSVVPGMNDSHSKYGSYSIVGYAVPSGYVKNANNYNKYDFAVLKVAPLKGRSIGDAVGYLGIKQVTNLKGTNIKLFGYPGDKMSRTGKVSQWGDTGYVKGDSPELAFYDIDTFAGQSGSAMLDSSNKIVGVHNGAYDLDKKRGPDKNGGIKMTKPVVQFIASYRR